MKKFLSVLTALAVFFGAHAQSFDLSHLGARLSIEAARPGNYNTGDGYTSISLFGRGPGFSLGAVYKFDLTENFFIEPGVSLYYNAMSINKHFLSDLLDESMDEILNAPLNYKLTNRSLRKFGFRIPVMVGYTFPLENDFNFRVFTGPMLDVGLSADLYYSIKMDGYDIHKAQSAYGKDRLLNRVNCYWNIGAGVTYAEHYSLSLQVDLGMCNMARKEKNVKPKYHESLVELTFGYNF